MNPATPNITITDADLLNQLLGDDGDSAQQAFRNLVERYERLVWTVCRRQLSHHNDIEDAFQTTFLRLAMSAKKIRKPESLSSWLFGVALRTAGRVKRQSLVQQSHVRIDNDIELVAADETPFEAIAKQHRMESVDSQLSLLEETYRTPLLLFYFSGLTTREIGHRIGISRSAVEGRLRRGRSKLRMELSAVGIHWSAGGLFAILMPSIDSFLSDLNRILDTCDQWIATTSGATSVVSSNTGFLGTGTKLMICKTAVVTAMASLVAVGTWLHSPTTTERENSTISLNADIQEETEAQLIEANDPPSFVDSIHNHFRELHDHVYSHFNKLFSTDEEVEFYLLEDIEQDMLHLMHLEDLEVTAVDEIEEILIELEVMEVPNEERNLLLEAFVLVHENEEDVFELTEEDDR